MIYVEQPPCERLLPWVRSLWYCRAPQIPHCRERVLPNGSVQLVVSLRREFLTDCREDGTLSARLPRAIVVGARGRFEIIDTADMDELVGVAFRPAGFARVFRERADLFFEQSIGLEDVCSRTNFVERLSDAETPRDKLRTMDTILCELLRPHTDRSEIVDQAIHLLQAGRVRIRECARSIGLSERRLSQVFREEVGLSPKTWCRIRRFQEAVNALHRGSDIPWADLALECGYYDQSHFANDFRAFSGIDPTTYSLLRGRWRNHVPLH